MAEMAYSKVAGGAFPGELARIYLIVGSDDALKHEAISRLLNVALDPAFADFDRESIDLGAGGDGSEGSDDPVVRILSAAAAAPFMSPRRVVMASSVQRLTKERQEALADGLKRVGALSCLILVADAQEFDGGKPKGKSVENALKKAAILEGVVLVCDAPDARDLRSRATALIAERGKRAEPEVLDILIARAAAAAGASGGDLNTLINETEKLITYAGDAEQITVRDARQVIAEFGRENIFQLLDAIGARDPKSALSLVDTMLDSGEKPDGIVARTFVMIERHFRLMALAKYLGEKRVGSKSGLPAEVQEVLSSELTSFATGQSYRIAGYARQAAHFSWEDLTCALSRILLSDMMMKGIAPGDTIGVQAPMVGEDPTSNLRMLVVSLCLLGK